MELSLEKFMVAVKNMRDQQKRYFSHLHDIDSNATRTRLTEAKHCEKEVDMMIESYANKDQTSLL
jgi:hypothetical protein